MITWDEIDFERKLIRLPAGRVKNKSGHTIPLSAPALAIIQSIPQREGHGNLFGTGPRPFSGFSKAKAAVDKRIADLTAAEPKDWRLHDLRKHADTMMRER
jgi:integrase